MIKWIAHFLINALMLNKVSPVDHAAVVQALVRARRENEQLQSYANSLDLELVNCRREIEDLRRARQRDRMNNEHVMVELASRVRPPAMTMTVPPIGDHYLSVQALMERQRLMEIERATRRPQRARPPFPGTTTTNFTGTEPEDL